MKTFSLPAPMPAMCKDCPFNPDSSMGDSLGPERMQGIKGVAFFPCHKTTEVTRGEEAFDPELPKQLQYQHCAGHLALKAPT